eukprot:1195295-Pyramimonas_sp.AAC.1
MAIPSVEEKKRREAANQGAADGRTGQQVNSPPSGTAWERSSPAAGRLVTEQIRQSCHQDVV